MSTEKHLKVVPFKPDPYTAGNILSAEDSVLYEDPQTIGAALSLYFQWPERRRSCATFPKRNSKAFPCTLDYDRDEANPSEIRILLNDFEDALNVVPGAVILVRFEVFKTTYEFSTKLSAVSANPGLDSWHVIAEVPANLKVLRHRKLPRVRLTEEQREGLGKVRWQADGKSVDLQIFEMSLASIRASCPPPTVGAGKIIVGAVEVSAQIKKAGSEETIFNLRFETPMAFGAYFDLYRQVAFPSLRSRYEIPYEAGLNLYSKSGYFGRFGAEKSEQEKKEIASTWEAIKPAFHEASADYYIVNKENTPTGCSALVHSNFSEDEEIWMMHQLCAVKDPALLEQSGVLYRWRGEYLAGRPGQHSAAAFFRSESRWLERIYVRHSLNSKGKTVLLPMTMYRGMVSATERSEAVKFDKISIGKIERITTRTKDLWACGNPRYLNAAENLDTVIAVWRPIKIEELIEVAGQMARSLKQETMSVAFMVMPDTDVSSLKATRLLHDRFCQIPKDEMLTFISCVEHSVAVTERKSRSGGG